MRIRLKDIAKQADVSVGAVSQVLNNKPIRISEDKKKLIQQLAKENNYSPNIAAKSLVSNKTNTIGLVIPDINNPFFASLAKTVEDQLRKAGYLLILVNSDDRFESEQELVRLLLNRGVDGLILALSNESYTFEQQQREMLKGIDIPLVLVDRGVDNFEGSQVFYNNRLGGYLATRHLIDQGHRRIGAMMNPSKNINCVYRHQGYLDALAEAGIDFQDAWSVPTKFQFEDAYDKADQLLNNQEITGIVAGNDLIALGIIKRAREQGKRVPEDISLVGYDNLPLNELLETALTSVEQDVDVLGEKAVECLFSAFEKQEMRFVQLKPKLVQKGSVKQL